MPHASVLRPLLLVVACTLVAACPGDDDPGEPVCSDVTSSVSINPPATGVLCPYAPDGAGPPTSGVLVGDREFAGNGPLMTIEVDAALSPDATSVVATILFSAVEIGGDTSITQQFTRTLYSAPSGSTILSIDSATSSSIVAESPDGGFEIGQCGDGPLVPAGDISITGGLVASVAMIGDTGFLDVSDDNNCFCDTRVDNLVFNPVSVTLNTAPSDPSCFETSDTATETTGPTPGECGEACEVDGDCASGSCFAGVCGSDCEPGSQCNVSGATGVCQAGQTECNGCASSCVSITPASDEVCDGLDNDCDGSTDEALGGGDCTTTPDGCDIEVTGQEVCSGGSMSCVAQPAVDYCQGCGGPCGNCSVCIPNVNVCTPNFQCTGPVGEETCQENDTCQNPPPTCWLPSDLQVVGNCAP